MPAHRDTLTHWGTHEALSGSCLTSVCIGQVLGCVPTAVGLGVLVGLLYMFTHRKVGYSQSYVLAMPMLSGLVSTIIVMM